MKSLASAACLLVLLWTAGCTRPDRSSDPNVYDTGNAAALSPGTRPVRVGEEGAAFPACNGRGQVRNLSTTTATLALHAAPFDEASEIAQLAPDTQVFLCTRSLDQNWLGIVVPPAVRPDTDCGVTARIDTPADYSGPCRSGWARGAYITPLVD